MTDAISSVAAVSQGQQKPALQSTFGAVEHITMSPSAPAQAESLGDIFRSSLETFQSAGSRLEKSADAPFLDPVERAKADLTGLVGEHEKVVIGASSGTSATLQSDGSAMLRKSFDHALFVTLVSQIVNGASQATSTLIKQQ